MNVRESPFDCVLDARASLGECPTWSAAGHALYWVDINAPALHRFDPVTGHDAAFPMPSSIGCFGVRDGGGFIVALRDGIWLARDDGMLQEKVAEAPYDDPSFHRFNDGRVDREGRFWAGTMNERRDAPSAGLYRVDPDFTVTRVLAGITTSNGLAWSPDGRTMYHADTPTCAVRAFDFDAASGLPSRERVFHRFSAEGGRPDGAAVDAEGYYWIALYRGGRIARISPGGDEVASYPIPAMCPTMCAFGGANLRTLYVTTARQERGEDELRRLPHSGGIFAMSVEVPGLPEPAFRG
jgi:sugar lactone lactonase YvrE